MALNALTLGGYGTYMLWSGVWAGYKEDGWIGALNAVNPLYAIGRLGADAYLATDRGDYQAAGAAGVKAAVLGAATVAGAVAGVGALEAEGAAAEAVAAEEEAAVAGATRGVGTALTSFDDVASHVSTTGKLPENFITKAEARASGWNPATGNLAEVTRGKSIGGDVFANREGLLPSAPGRVYFEADINYTSGFRGADRLIYSNDGLIFKTADHYRTFTQIK